MAVSTARYLGFNLTAAYLQYNVTGTVTEIQWFFSNKWSIKPDEDDIVFEGDGLTKHVYITKGLTVELASDAFNAAAISTLFTKNVVTASVPNSGSALLWYGDTVEAAGKPGGLRLVGSAIKDVAGVQSSVNTCLWVPLGTATLGAPGDIETAKKWGSQVLRLSATRTSVDVGGNALPSVPTGGAMYAMYEV